VDQTSIPRGCNPCGRCRVRRDERLRTWVSGAGAEERTAGLEAANDHDRADTTAGDLEGCNWTAGDRRAAGKAACAATGHTKSQSNYEIAKLTRELAGIAVEEYEEVNYPRDLATVGAEIKLAESDLARSEVKLNRKKAQFSLEQAQSKRDVLIKYTKGKTIKELESAVEKARLDELAKEAAWDLEKAKETELERQLRLRTN
jgi:hypothetical protein